MSVPQLRSTDWNYGGKKWKLSRAKIEAFLNCAKCFYLNNKMGLKDLPMIPYTLNSTVDLLLKKEFDEYRVRQEPHPLQQQFNFPGVPAQHPQLDAWRENFVGIQHTLPNGIIVSGAIDDLWKSVDSKNEYVIVDYKSTAGEYPVEQMDQEYHRGYQRQMDIYQWLLKQQGLPMAEHGCFLYCTANQSATQFDNQLEFAVRLITYKIDDTWVEKTIYEALDCLEGDMPNSNPACSTCKWSDARSSLLLNLL